MTKENQIQLLTDQLSANMKTISMVLGLANEGHGTSAIFDVLDELQKINTEISKELTILKNNSQES